MQIHQIERAIIRSIFSDSEDVATLFEATMMKYHYNSQQTVGFASKQTGSVTCDSISMVWGVRDRLTNPLVAERARFVSEYIFSDRVDFVGFFAGLALDEQSIDKGTTWCDVRDG